MIKQWLEEYKPGNLQEAEVGLREIMQEIALAGLQRSGFFEKAAFYGGTALRIFHGLDRFSEDLDFSLLEVNTDFSLEPYLEGIVKEAAALGMRINIKEKIKTKQSNFDSAFLKSETVWKELVLENIIPQSGLSLPPAIKIKLEVDTAPPLGFETEEKLLIKPFSFYVKCFKLPDLFAGKMHALLFRKWKQRVKGRDWYDMEWYIKKGVPLHLDHLIVRAKESGDWQQKTMTQKQLMKLLQDKINEISFNNVRNDIIRFIPNDSVLDIWSVNYFSELVKKIRFK
jgi:predicted nucleotidyltransferase component of viral defense system